MALECYNKLMKKIVLASGSPRRKQLLEAAGLEFTVFPSNYNEPIDSTLEPAALAKKLSEEKAKFIAPKFKNTIIIAADTLAVLNKKIIGKPKDEKEAIENLSNLSNKFHKVITGFTILDTEKDKSIIKSVESKVYFNKVFDKDIKEYVRNKKPFDKAGGYGIQELPKKFIKKIVGDYDNIVGLPVKTLLDELRKFNL